MGAAADRLGRVGKNLRTLPEEGVQQATVKVRKQILVALKADTGGDRRLSGLGARGRPLTVKVTRRSTGNIAEGRVMAGPRRQRAPWFWLEEGTDAGDRRIRGTSRRRGTAPGARTFRHSGTPAKRTWSRSVGPVLDEVREDFERQWRNAVRGG